jgi:hypothetical protein
VILDPLSKILKPTCTKPRVPFRTTLDNSLGNRAILIFPVNSIETHERMKCDEMVKMKEGQPPPVP